MSRLRLVVFDVDGTLVDSQADILAAMAAAFGQAGHPAPERAAVLSIVGLSLEVAVPRLAPDLDEVAHSAIVAGYKAAYVDLRARAAVSETSPLYPHARDTLDALHAQPELLLGVATGKSRRGLDKLIEGHGLGHLFVTRQVSDFHPSKPHPSMLEAALSETGVAPADAVMIGDTSFDMEMARAAGMRAVGVDWGYHGRAGLGLADHIIGDFRDLPPLLTEIWEDAA